MVASGGRTTRENRKPADRDRLARWVVSKRFEMLAAGGTAQSMEQVWRAAQVEDVDIRSAKDVSSTA